MTWSLLIGFNLENTYTHMFGLQDMDKNEMQCDGF